jgi:iron complex outermembrane recepter protein
MYTAMRLTAGALCAFPVLLFSTFALAQSDARRSGPETVIVTGDRIGLGDSPGPGESVTAADASMRVNAVNTEDLLRYAPDILVRKRHFGDTQDPISTRTSGIGQSARSLIYADGILLSSPIGNNNGTASPHWGLVSPQDVAQIDILYGPFAARYPGNSMGAVVEITTRMPQGFEMGGEALAAYQSFHQYATEGDYGSYQLQASLGDRDGAFAWRLSLDHLDTNSQPLAYVTLARPSSASAAGAPVSGAFADRNRTGAPIVVIGAGGFEHQVQDTPTFRATYDLPDAWRIAYTASLFHQDDDASVQSYLKDSTSSPVYSGSVNIGGYAYSIPVTSFSNNEYRWNQTYLAQGLTLRSSGSGAWRWQAAVSRFDYLSDNQRVPGVAVPAARSGGAGVINRMTGTAWTTADASGSWDTDGNTLSFGAHDEVVTLDLAKYNTADWIDGPQGSLASASKGRTATSALWAEDVWTFSPHWKATLGLRLENWRAYDGLNFSAAPALNVMQPKRSGNFASPKTALSWQALSNLTLTASYGTALRMPTVTELYQAVTTGATLTSPNPNLRPEHAASYDLSAVYAADSGTVRVSLFEEDLSDALISQTGPLALSNGSILSVSYVQNVDRVRSRGAEIVADRRDVVLPGLDLQGSVTFVDSLILKDSAFPAAVGKYTPNIPKWRVIATATYHANDQLDLSLGARYEDRLYATLDNSDTVTHTWQGFDSFFVVDARARYLLDGNWSAAFGIDNLTNDKYFLFHPFPQRTLVMELHYAD